MINDGRMAGVLLHPSSLPGGTYNGELGDDAYRFVDFVAAAGLKIWQVLPLGPTHADRSPYQCLSAFAGSVSYISLTSLLKNSWATNDKTLLHAVSSYHEGKASKFDCLQLALDLFEENADFEQQQAFEQFQQKNFFWLKDYALFIAIRQKFANANWSQWPEKFRDRDDFTILEFSQLNVKQIKNIEFEQFIFNSQWQALRHYANSKGIIMFGDLPLFVSHDSADVWAHRHIFKLAKNGEPTVIAGVPPDYFSETGQRWGNPLYDWQQIENTHYDWWIKRLEIQFKLFDLVRIDHFRGLEAYWEIPADHETALNGYWVKGPGDKFFVALQQHFGHDLALVAEDLGVITEEVNALRRQFKLPGMKILHFAFDSDAYNPYLPHNHEINSVVYSGTHDNDTTLGWYESLNEHVRARINIYFASEEPMPWLLIRAAMSSVARYAVLPMQDFMNKGSESRMNTPGTTTNNWGWRFEWQEINEQALADKVLGLCQLYCR